MGVSTKITQIQTDGGYAMTGSKCKGKRINLQEIFGADRDSFKVLLRLSKSFIKTRETSADVVALVSNSAVPA